MKPTLKRRLADFLRGIMGLEAFDQFTLALGINSHFNSNLEEMDFLKSIFRVRYPSSLPAMTLLDAGCNRGLWSQAFARKFQLRAAHLFEPNPKVAFKFFRAKVPELHRNLCGVSSVPGSCEIRISNYPGVTSSIGKSRVFNDSGSNALIKLVSLDSYFADLGGDPVGPVVLKVDVEGHDMEVLRGADGLFGRKKIDYVVIEIGFNPKDDFHSHFLTVHEFLHARGFAFCGFSEQFCVIHGEFYGMQWGNAIFALQSA